MDISMHERLFTLPAQTTQRLHRLRQKKKIRDKNLFLYNASYKSWIINLNTLRALSVVDFELQVDCKSFTTSDDRRQIRLSRNVSRGEMIYLFTILHCGIHHNKNKRHYIFTVQFAAVNH